MPKKKVKKSPVVVVTLVLAIVALGVLAYIGLTTNLNVEIRGSTKRSDACGRARDAFDACMKRNLKGGARNEEALQSCQSEFTTRHKACPE